MTVAISRPKKGTDAAKAITALIQSKSSLCSSMSSTERERLARASHQLLRIALVFSDPDGSVQKLRSALIGLEALGVGANSNANGDSRKRDSSHLDDSAANIPVTSSNAGGVSNNNAMVDNIDYDEDDEIQQQLRLSAVAAVNELESQKKHQLLLHQQEIRSSSASESRSNITALSTSNALVTETELSSDLAVISNDSMLLSSEFRNVHLVTVTSGSNVSNTQGLFVPNSKLLSQDAGSTSIFTDLAMQSFQRALDNYYEMKALGEKVSSVKLHNSHFDLAFSYNTG